MAPPMYRNNMFLEYTWPAALMVKETFPSPLICGHMISIFRRGNSDPERRARSHDKRHHLTQPCGWLRYDVIVSVQHRRQSLHVFLRLHPRPSTFAVRGVSFFSYFSFCWRYTVLSVLAASGRNRSSASRSTAVKNILNRGGAITHLLPETLPHMELVRALSII